MHLRVSGLEHEERRAHRLFPDGIPALVVDVLERDRLVRNRRYGCVQDDVDRAAELVCGRAEGHVSGFATREVGGHGDGARIARFEISNGRGEALPIAEQPDRGPSVREGEREPMPERLVGSGAHRDATVECSAHGRDLAGLATRCGPAAL